MKYIKFIRDISASFVRLDQIDSIFMFLDNDYFIFSIGEIEYHVTLEEFEKQQFEEFLQSEKNLFIISNVTIIRDDDNE
jgi:hypothetical protein